MINYKLAKKLEEARYPQGYNNETELLGIRPGIVGSKCQSYYSPSLSELIEACNEYGWFRSLTHDKGSDVWNAEYASMVVKNAFGKTPEEAVARLWLKLNKKK